MRTLTYLTSLLTLTSGTLSAQVAPTRFRQFHAPTGFISSTPWLDTDEPDPDDDLAWLNVAVGNDNPYFDLRRRGDPGGVGFTRVNTQIQLFDVARTSIAIGVQAVTPLGLQSEGLADDHGPTVITPALAVVHELDAGLSVQAFIGKHVPLMNRATQSVRRDVHYGLALQRALSTDTSDPLSTLFISVGALGQWRWRENVPISWEVLPGLHWKPMDSWIMSAGYVLPVGPTSAETGGHWQLTWLWQF